VLSELFPFQREDVEKLINHRGGLIANEMGTGKTYEGIARDLIIRENNTEWPHLRTLIIAPTTVLASWEEHLEELTTLKYVRVDPKNRKGSFVEFVQSEADVFLVHWEALRLMPELLDIYWVHVIADECHRAKNRKAQQTRALKKVKGAFKTAMSGTPVVNRPDELWSVLNWLYPQDYKAFWTFYRTYVDYEIGYPHGYHIVKGPKNVAQLQAKIEPFTTRRLKEDVLPELPDKYYTNIWVELDPKQRRAYNEMKSEMVAWIGQHEDQPLVAPVVIAQLIRLQQFALAYASPQGEGLMLDEPSSKLDALMQIIDDNPEEQIVVFSQFKQILRLLEARLHKLGVPFCALTGDVPQGERGDLVRRFQSGEDRIFIGTIAAGGVGITLTASSTVVFLDRSWSPALNQQAEDRLHRIGQKDAVQVIDIMARNTVDLGRKQKLALKWSWIRELLGDT